MDLQQICDEVRVLEARVKGLTAVTPTDADRLNHAATHATSLRRRLEADLLVADLEAVIEEVRAGEVEPWRNLRTRLEHLAAGWDPF